MVISIALVIFMLAASVIFSLTNWLIWTLLKNRAVLIIVILMILSFCGIFSTPYIFVNWILS